MIYEWRVDEDLPPSECEKPRYLLPEGCKDLNDVIRLKERAAAIQKQRTAIFDALEKYASTDALEKYASMATEHSTSILAQLSGALEKHFSAPSNELPLCITIPDPVSVGDLAGMLHLKPYQLISLLIKYKIFVNPQAEITFEIASKICTCLGVEVKKADGS